MRSRGWGSLALLVCALVALPSAARADCAAIQFALAGDTVDFQRVEPGPDDGEPEYHAAGQLARRAAAFCLHPQNRRHGGVP